MVRRASKDPQKRACACGIFAFYTFAARVQRRCYLLSTPSETIQVEQAMPLFPIAPETIDARLIRCGISRRSFLVFCTSLMVAAPYGLAITNKKTPEDVADELGKVLRPPVIWLHFQDCTGCTETMLQTSHPGFADLILNVISLEYHHVFRQGLP
jgi:hypothetical protein